MPRGAAVGGLAWVSPPRSPAWSCWHASCIDMIQPMQRGRDQPRDEMRLKETTAGAGPAMVGVVRRPLALLPALGPGPISGPSDNHPTTVASPAVIRATTAYGPPG